MALTLDDFKIKPKPKFDLKTIKSKDIKDLAKEYTSLALETLADIASNGSSESARVAASMALLDRGHGKIAQEQPTSQNTTYNDNRQVITVTDEILRLIPQDQLKRLADKSKQENIIDQPTNPQ